MHIVESMSLNWWLCLDCQKLLGKSLEDSTWKDKEGQFVPNVVECSNCKQDRVCAWFGKKDQPIRL